MYLGWVDGDAPLGGKGTVVETDKAFIGGKDKAGHDDKAIVLGIVERGGEVITRIPKERFNLIFECMSNEGLDI